MVSIPQWSIVQFVKIKMILGQPEVSWLCLLNRLCCSVWEIKLEKMPCEISEVNERIHLKIDLAPRLAYPPKVGKKAKLYCSCRATY